MQIWKFKLKEDDSQTMWMQKDAEILTVMMQYGSPYIFAMVDPSKDKEKRKFIVLREGNSFDVNIEKYIGSYKSYGGSFIWHVFEIN